MKSFLPLRYLPLLVLLLLGACRAAGPEKPARTVAEFFNKYENSPGFKATSYEPGLLTRIAIGRIGRIAEGSDAMQALTAVRVIRGLTFTPTSSGARNLTERGLLNEVDYLLKNERYEPLNTTSADAGNTYRYSVRRTGTDKVQEIVATTRLKDVPDSFVMLAISGDFTQQQLDQLTKVLPGIANEVVK
jgi:hypothetical protein